MKFRTPIHPGDRVIVKSEGSYKGYKGYVVKVACLRNGGIDYAVYFDKEFWPKSFGCMGEDFKRDDLRLLVPKVSS